jgi:quercetin dioxygenase-like cupin family protein
MLQVLTISSPHLLKRCLPMLVILLVAASALAQEKPKITEPPSYIGFGSRPWQACEGLQGCAFVLLAGDPATGASQWLFRLEAGMPFPAHWHSTPENFMGLQGALVFEFETGDMYTLRRGDFLHYQAGMTHGGYCAEGKDCLYYVFNPLPYDVHLVETD